MSPVKPITEPIVELAALLNDYFGIQLLLFFLFFNASSNSYTTSFFTAFLFYSLFFYFKLLPLVFLILFLLSPTVNALLLARFFARLYHAALYIVPVTTVTSYFIFLGFCYPVRR